MCVYMHNKNLKYDMKWLGMTSMPSPQIIPHRDKEMFVMSQGGFL